MCEHKSNAIIPAVRKLGKDLCFDAARDLRAGTPVGWNRLAMEVLTLLFVRNFESNFFLRVPCKNFIHIDFPLPKNRADHETAENTCNGEANDSTSYNLHISKRSRWSQWNCTTQQTSHGNTISYTDERPNFKLGFPSRGSPVTRNTCRWRANE